MSECLRALFLCVGTTPHHTNSVEHNNNHKLLQMCPRVITMPISYSRMEFLFHFISFVCLCADTQNCVLCASVLWFLNTFDYKKNTGNRKRPSCAQPTESILPPHTGTKASKSNVIDDDQHYISHRFIFVSFVAVVV